MPYLCGRLPGSPKVPATSPYLISILSLRNGELSARKCLPRSWLNLILNFMCAHQKILRGAVYSGESCVALKYEKQLSSRLALNSGGLSEWVGGSMSRWVVGLCNKMADLRAEWLSVLVHSHCNIQMLQQNEYYVFQFIMNYSTFGLHFL